MTVMNSEEGTLFMFQEGETPKRKMFVHFSGRAAEYRPDLGTEECVGDIFKKYNIQPDDHIKVGSSPRDIHWIIRVPPNP